jgi:hypothetical protein
MSFQTTSACRPTHHPQRPSLESEQQQHLMMFIGGVKEIKNLLLNQSFDVRIEIMTNVHI